MTGHFYYEERRAENALVHLDRSYEIYRALCSPRAVSVLLTRAVILAVYVLWLLQKPGKALEEDLPYIVIVLNNFMTFSSIFAVP